MAILAPNNNNNDRTWVLLLTLLNAGVEWLLESSSTEHYDLYFLLNP